MKEFREFQKNRLQTDPAAKDLTDYQWEQAYEAYKSSRRKVRGSSASKTSSRSSRREGSKSRQRSDDSSSSSSSSSRKVSRSSRKDRVKRTRGSSSASGHQGEELTFQLSTAGLTLRQVRLDSAYRELRVLIRLMAWVAIGLIVVSLAAEAFHGSESSVVVAALLEAILLVLCVLVLRPFLEAMLDIPDLALKRRKESVLSENQAPLQSSTETEET